MISRTTATKSVEALDLGVSGRQAFGNSFAEPSNLDSALNDYWAGKLVLPPQPVWEGDPTDWAADPFEDRNWRFQHHTLRWINPLRWAALNGDARARDEWVRIARSWMEVNIPAETSPSDFAWRDMADGNRAIQLSLGAPLLNASDTWFVELLQYHRDWLLNEEHIVGRNHGMHQHAGLLVVGAVLRDRTAIDTAVSRMEKQFTSVFDAQGANDEGSVSYHQMNISWWNDTWRRARVEGVRPPKYVEERLTAATNVLAHLSLPDGQLPQIGDSARGRVQMGKSATTDFVASGGAKGKAPSEVALILDRGYVISRSGWGATRPLQNESHLLARFGEDLKAHSHQDRGSVHIYAAGTRWLTDSGFHSYQTKAPEVRYLKSRAAHNVATLVGIPYDESARIELVDSKIDSKFHDFTFSDRGYQNVNLTRRVIYLTEPDCWIIIDACDAAVQIRQSWQVEPNVVARLTDNGFRLMSSKKSFGMYWLGRVPRLKRIQATDGSFDGWVGTRWKTMEPSSKLIATASAERPHLVTLLGAHHPVPIAIVDSRVSIDRSVQLRIARGATIWNIRIDDETVYIFEA